jgi:hypothetical protein
MADYQLRARGGRGECGSNGGRDLGGSVVEVEGYGGGRRRGLRVESASGGASCRRRGRWAARGLRDCGESRG